MVKVIRSPRLGNESRLHPVLSLLLYLSTLTFPLVLMLEANTQYPQMFKRTTGLLVLVTWVALTSNLRFLMLGKLYNLGLYVRMLNEIVKKVLIFAFLYGFFLLGFTVAFSIILPNEFKNPWRITRTLIMMIGEIDYEGDFKESGNFERAFLFVFTFLFPIILSNLLIGLTVSNVDVLCKSANITGLQFKLQNIDFLDGSIAMSVLSRFARMVFKQSSHRISDHEGHEVPGDTALLFTAPLIRSPSSSSTCSGTSSVPSRSSKFTRLAPWFSVRQRLRPFHCDPVQVKLDSYGRRVVGEAWSYLGLTTFVPGSVVQGAREAEGRLVAAHTTGQ
jgi:hypothetical protein